MTETDFPRHVYKKDEDGPETLVVKGEKYKYSSKLVKGESDMKDALDEGYVDSFHDAIFKAPEPVKATSDDEEDDDF